MILLPFRIIKPIRWQGRMWGPGQESKLRMAGWPPYLFYRAIERKLVEPAYEGESWYLGPNYRLFWDQGLFTEQTVWDKIRKDATRVWHLGTVRRRRVYQYLKNRV